MTDLKKLLREAADAIEALQASVAEARNAALEEAAKIADTCKRQNGPLSARGFENNYRAGIESGAEAIAAAIRAAKEKK